MSNEPGNIRPINRLAAYDLAVLRQRSAQDSNFDSSVSIQLRLGNRVGRRGFLARAVAASAALPWVFNPYNYGIAHDFLDQSVRDLAGQAAALRVQREDLIATNAPSQGVQQLDRQLGGVDYMLTAAHESKAEIEKSQSVSASIHSGVNALISAVLLATGYTLYRRGNE